MIKRVEGTAGAVDTPIGHLPGAGDLGVDGLDLAPETLQQLLAVDREAWYEEMEAVGEYLAGYGDHTPVALTAEQRRISALLA